MRIDEKRGLVIPVPQRGAIIETYDFERLDMSVVVIRALVMFACVLLLLICKLI